MTIPLIFLKLFVSEAFIVHTALVWTTIIRAIYREAPSLLGNEGQAC